MKGGRLFITHWILVKRVSLGAAVAVTLMHGPRAKADLLCGVGGSAARAAVEHNLGPGGNIHYSTDPVGPFPLSTMVPFQWSSIEGVWRLEIPNGGGAVHFSFAVQSDCDHRKFLDIVWFNPQSGSLIGRGTGLANDDMTVKGGMSTVHRPIMIFVRQYRASNLSSEVTTVVTLRPFDGDGSTDLHLLAKKESTLTFDAFMLKQKEEAAKKTTKVGRVTSGPRRS